MSRSGQDQQALSNRPARGDRFCDGDLSWIPSIQACKVYTPTVEEFEDPMAYIARIAPEASRTGICKIVSPVAPSVPAAKVLQSFRFDTCEQLLSLPEWDCRDNKATFFVGEQGYSFGSFETKANRFYARKFSSLTTQSSVFVEREFWKELLERQSESVQYATDVDGSAFSCNAADPLALSNWNLKHFSALPGSTLRLLKTVIPGVTDPMLYIGMLFSMFAWHVEDHYLYSINYQHCGASKTWYGVPGEAAERFEKVVKEQVYGSKLLSECGQAAAYEFLIQKTTMFPPNILLQNDVPVFRAVQAPGEFVVTFPRAYHTGFSHGFNCGEAVNFGMADWFPYGAAACRRYCLLKRMPLLPHEELLWRETERMKGDTEKPIKRCFLRLMSDQHRVRWLLKKRGAAIHITSNATMNVSCEICSHLCYIAHLTCDCFPRPICLNHVAEMSKCKCGSRRCLHLHKNIKEMDEIAKMFQNEFGSEQTPPLVEEGTSPSAEEEDFMVAGEDYKLFESIDAEEEQISNICSSVITSASLVDISEAAENRPMNNDKHRIPVELSSPPVVVNPTAAKERARVSLCFKKRSIQDCKDDTKNEKPCEDLVLLLKDIVSELKIEGSLEEITGRWEQELKNLGLDLSYSYVDSQMGLSYKAFQHLSKVLPDAQAAEVVKLYRFGGPYINSQGLKRKETTTTNTARGGSGGVCSAKKLCERKDLGGKSSISSLSVDQRKRVMGRAMNVDSRQSGRSDNGSCSDRRKPFPKLRIKGPSPPSLRRSKADETSEASVSGDVRAEGLTRSVDSSHSFGP